MRRGLRVIISATALLAIAVGIGWQYRMPLHGAMTRWFPPPLTRRGEFALDMAAKNEVKRDAEDRRVPQSSCTKFGRGSTPQLCLDRISPAVTTPGATITLRVRWRNMPAGGLIRIVAQNAAPAGQRFLHGGPAGAIAVAPIAGAAEGAKIVLWDGVHIACAPADIPTLCDAGQIGRFTLRAWMAIGGDPWSPGMVRPAAPPSRLVRSEGVGIEFTGPPRLPQYGSYLAYAGAMDAVARLIPGESRGYDISDDAWSIVRRLGPWRKDWLSWCADSEAVPPLAGKVTVCFPRSRRDEFGLTVRDGEVRASGTITTMPGIPTPAGAKRLAQRAAIGFARGKVQFDHEPGWRELEAMGPEPRRAPEGTTIFTIGGQTIRPLPGEDLTTLRRRAETIWQKGIRYVSQQSEVYFRPEQGGFWLVTVSNDIRDLAPGPSISYVRYTYRVDARRMCLLHIFDEDDPTQRYFNDRIDPPPNCPSS